MDSRISRRGVYYDISLSPYEFKTPYGDIFKFSSAKKLEIYRREIIKELERFDKFIIRFGIKEYLTDSTFKELSNAIYQMVYNRVEVEKWDVKNMN